MSFRHVIDPEVDGRVVNRNNNSLGSVEESLEGLQVASRLSSSTSASEYSRESWRDSAFVFSESISR